MEVNNFDSFNVYCGPSVLSIFTKARVDDCAEEIQKINKAFKVKGVYPADLMKAGEAMGLEFSEIPSFQSRSIFWAGSVLVKLPPAQYLVTIPKHYIALEVRDGSLYICDNHTKTEIELQNSSRLSQKIERVWKVTKLHEYVKPFPVKSEYFAAREGMDVLVSVKYDMSDGEVKLSHLGSFKVASPEGMREIAFKLMELADESS